MRHVPLTVIQDLENHTVSAKDYKIIANVEAYNHQKLSAPSSDRMID